MKGEQILSFCVADVCVFIYGAFHTCEFHRERTKFKNLQHEDLRFLKSKSDTKASQKRLGVGTPFPERNLAHGGTPEGNRKNNQSVPIQFLTTNN